MITFPLRQRRAVKRALLLFLLFISAGGASGQPYYNTEVPVPLFRENTFTTRKPDTRIPPAFAEIRAQLPEPVWPGHPDAIRCYWRAWEIAFSNLQPVTPQNGFIAPYIDAAFNKHIFMWDTSFMLLFGRYAHHAFNFQQSLDNFYSRQHSNGYICRELSEADGHEIFEQYDPSSTGPDIMPWTEWEYYLNFRDKARLSAVFYPLLAYYEWFRTFRSWPDGTYFSTGWGCGMDNQPRVPPGYSPQFSPAFMSWADITLQQVMSAKILLKMAAELGEQAKVSSIAAELSQLEPLVNEKLWDPASSFYMDRYRNGALSGVKSIGAYWALLAGIVPAGRLQPFLAHLENTSEFNRLHRVPSLAADHPDYRPQGGYWRGGVWAPTTYMVLRGLSLYHCDSLAFEIARNHFSHVIGVFRQTGTLWENYAPDLEQGNNQREMVGWTGLTPIAVLFEYLFGIRANVPENTIVWDIRLKDAFGLKKYPFGRDGLVDFWCAARRQTTDRPRIRLSASVPFTLKIHWDGGTRTLHIHPNQSGQLLSL